MLYVWLHELFMELTLESWLICRGKEVAAWLGAHIFLAGINYFPKGLQGEASGCWFPRATHTWTSFFLLFLPVEKPRKHKLYLGQWQRPCLSAASQFGFTQPWANVCLLSTTGYCEFKITWGMVLNPRMYVLSLRGAWSLWQGNTGLEHRTQMYQMTSVRNACL